MKPDRKITKKEQARATFKRLVEVAMQEFSGKGYARASTEAIAREANVTRGALYHHFKGKQDLFYAVFKEAQMEIGRRIEADADAANDDWDGLISGCRAFLKACSDPELQQIVVIDAPSVLNWSAFREVDANMPGSGFSLLRAHLQALMDQNVIKRLPADALAHLLSGAMDEAVVWIAQSKAPGKALNEAQITLEALVQSLRR